MEDDDSVSQDFVETVRIENFGCVRDAQLDLTRLHALIGPNDSGKSTVLSAIRTLCEVIRRGEPQLRQDGRLDPRGVPGSKVTMGWANTAVAIFGSGSTYPPAGVRSM